MATVLDLETAPHPDLPNPPESYLNSGMGNRVKQEAIEAKRKENLEKWYEEAALDWRTAQVTAVCVVQNSHPYLAIQCSATPKAAEKINTLDPEVLPKPIVQQYEIFDKELEKAKVDPPVALDFFPDESGLLNWTWSFIGGGYPIIGFNQREFDLPILIGRSLDLGIVTRGEFNFAKYRTSGQIFDLMEALNFHDSFQRRGWTLETYTERFKIRPGPDGREGKDIPKHWLKGEYGIVLAHVYRDALTTYNLSEKFGEFRRVVR